MESSGKQNIVFITGRTGSGKTEIAKFLSSAFNIPITSFGNVVRAEAASRGLPIDEKKVLQKLGQEMVDHEMARFCKLVLDSVPGDPEWFVIEGLRHRSVLAAMQEAMPHANMFVLHVTTSQEARFSRMETSRGWSRSRCQSYEDDPTETEIDTSLMSIADYSINNSGPLNAACEASKDWLERIISQTE